MENKKIHILYSKIRIGFNYFLSWQCPGKIDFYEDRLVAYAFPFKKTIPYSKIKKLVWSHFGRIKFEHDAGGAPFVAFLVITKNDPEIRTISQILKCKGVFGNK